MLVVSRFSVDPAGQERFAADARVALDALAERSGYLSGRVGRSVDDPAEWTVVTEWDGVGAYRRALSAYDVKVRAAPLLARSRDEPSAYEVLVARDGAAGAAVVTASDRAADADTAAPGPPRQEPS